VTQTKNWSVDLNSLTTALDRFYVTNPDAYTQARVREWLEELPSDPLKKGQEDPESPGVFFGRVLKTDVGVLYVPNTDPDEMVIYISDISSE
jgi:hypothetical protein